MNQIGLKLADGSFYPVIDGGVAGRKRLILTTVRDNQDAVQIDLYRGEGGELDSAGYLGTLSIEEIQAAPKNDPEIELILGLDEEGTLSASAADLMGGGRKSLSVQIGGTPAVGPPEFELEREGSPGRGTREPEKRGEDLLTGETYPIGPGDRRKEHLHRRKRRPLLLVAFIVLALLLIAAIAFIVFRSVDGGRVPSLLGRRQAVETVGKAGGLDTAGSTAQLAQGEPVESESAQTGKPEAMAPATSETPEPEGSGSAASEAPVPGAAEAEKKTPLSAPAGGVWYDIKRGDTLWDIAATYYRNPWLYPRLARANKIVNPDLIFAGSKLFVPEL
ncbi:MAG: LysM peptidoglycan-binding domain-containing protein [Spirochaetales bacterium]|nr:LysM peptidoglycan-binding domain-containing protein [Spirochaetales bacterium]